MPPQDDSSHPDAAQTDASREDAPSAPSSRGRPPGAPRKDPGWDARAILRLRRHMRLTQAELAEELNARQQTVSEWETGRYRPRGPSARLLTLIAEQAGFEYRTAGPAQRAPQGEITPQRAGEAAQADASAAAASSKEGSRKGSKKGARKGSRKGSKKGTEDGPEYGSEYGPRNTPTPRRSQRSGEPPSGLSPSGRRGSEGPRPARPRSAGGSPAARSSEEP